MLALDIDGTLLRPDRTISPRVRDAVRSAAKLVPTFLATARPPRSVRAIHEELKLSMPQVNYNGALLWDPIDSKIIEHTPLTAQVCASLIVRVRAMVADAVLSIEHLDRWYTDRIDDRFTTETGRLFSPDFVVPLEALLSLGATKLMFHANPRQVDLLRSSLEPAFGSGVTFIRTDPDLLQMMNRSTSKWKGILSLAARIGVPAEAIMTIGDNENDEEMIREAGVGIAMANACGMALDVADWIAPSNVDDGVAAAIERFILR